MNDSSSNNNNHHDVFRLSAVGATCLQPSIGRAVPESVYGVEA
jgi:hypothetical protein